MNHLAFEWDDGKNTLNKRKHRISFEEALTVFADDHALLPRILNIQPRRIGSY
jgi:hypothetical protein